MVIGEWKAYRGAIPNKRHHEVQSSDRRLLASPALRCRSTRHTGLRGNRSNVSDLRRYAAHWGICLVTADRWPAPLLGSETTSLEPVMLPIGSLVGTWHGSLARSTAVWRRTRWQLVDPQTSIRAESITSSCSTTIGPTNSGDTSTAIRRLRQVGQATIRLGGPARPLPTLRCPALGLGVRGRLNSCVTPCWCEGVPPQISPDARKRGVRRTLPSRPDANPSSPRRGSFRHATL